MINNIYLLFVVIFCGILLGLGQSSLKQSSLQKKDMTVVNDMVVFKEVYYTKSYKEKNYYVAFDLNKRGYHTTERLAIPVASKRQGDSLASVIDTVNQYNFYVNPNITSKNDINLGITEIDCNKCIVFKIGHYDYVGGIVLILLGLCGIMVCIFQFMQKKKTEPLENGFYSLDTKSYRFEYTTNMTFIVLFSAIGMIPVTLFLFHYTLHMEYFGYQVPIAFAVAISYFILYKDKAKKKGLATLHDDSIVFQLNSQEKQIYFKDLKYYYFYKDSKNNSIFKLRFHDNSKYNLMCNSNFCNPKTFDAFFEVFKQNIEQYNVRNNCNIPRRITLLKKFDPLEYEKQT